MTYAIDQGVVFEATPASVPPLRAPRAARAPRVKKVSAKRRVQVAARTLAGTIGAYAVAATLAAVLARVLPIDRAQAMMVGTLAALVAVPAVVVWAFLAASARRAVIGTLLTAVVLALIAWRLGPPA